MNRYSVILRAYNAGAQLAQSVESVVNQRYPHWELVIVNDGSVDNTRQVAEAYAAKDSRILVVNQSNRGCVLATQAGIEASSGDYVVCLDAGDRYEPEYLWKVNQAFEENQTDMVVVNYHIVGVDGGVSDFVYFEQNRTLSMPQALELILKTTNSSICNKVIRRDKLIFSQQHRDFFEEAGKTLNFGEDLYQLISPLLRCDNVRFLADRLYDYVLDAGSITRQKSRDPWEDAFQRVRLLEVTFETIRRAGYLTDSIQSILQMNCAVFIHGCVVQIMRNGRFSGENRKRLRENRFYRDIVARVPLTELRKRVFNRPTLYFAAFNKLYLNI